MSENKTQHSQLNGSAVSVFKNQSLLFKIFEAFISNGQISVTENEIRKYVMEYLKLSGNKYKIPAGFVEHLPVMLVAIVNMWPGWFYKDEYYNGNLEKYQYYLKFQTFFINKVIRLLNGQFVAAMKAVDTQQNNEDITFAPYAISIKCPSYMLPSIAFTNVGDDVVMKQQRDNRWRELSLVQLLNWPHVEVKFQTDDIYFVRRQATEFTRYLNLSPHKSKKPGNCIIEHAESFGYQRCYSYNMLKKYIQVYMNSLISVSMPTVKLHEIWSILTQFLEDIRYINVNKSVATNTVVRFKMSPAPFIRNIKLLNRQNVRKNKPRLGYCEIITPKIQFILVYFRAEQLDGPVLRFDYTDEIQNAGPQKNAHYIPNIKYKCTFCNVGYQCENSNLFMMQHMRTKHQMEQDVRCTLCKKEFNVVDLAGCRWKHDCQSTERSN